MFDAGSQTQWLIPMAISLGWGIIFATAITLVLVPVITLIFEDIRVLFCKLYNRPIERVDHDEEEKKLFPAEVGS